MKILFFDARNYDKAMFEEAGKSFPAIELEYLEADLVPRTAVLAKGFDAVCAFVSSDVGSET